MPKERECESCGNYTKETVAMISAGSRSGLSVCVQCAATLVLIGWERL